MFIAIAGTVGKLEQIGSLSNDFRPTFICMMLLLQGSLNERVYIRVACHKSVNNKITSWRQQHDDWESLAAFALSKTTGRRYKKKKHTTAIGGTEEGAGNVEVAKLKEFVERVSGKVEGDVDSDKESALESDSDAASSHSSDRLISESVGKTKIKKDVSSSDHNSTTNKSPSSKLATATPTTTSRPNVERDKQPQLKSVKQKVDVVVKQITLDQLCDEELFLPPLDNSEDSELEEATCSASTEPKAENNFFADGSDSSDAEVSVQEMEYESGDEQEDEEDTSTTVGGSVKLIERPQYNEVQKANGSRSFGTRRDSSSKSYGDRTERFSNKNFTKSRGHFPNMRGDSYPKKFGKTLQGKFGEPAACYSRKQRYAHSDDNGLAQCL